jgi:hypothetical protein
MLYSKRGVGKTFIALSIAYAVASGGKCLRWESPKPRRVLLIDGEMPLETLQSRATRAPNRLMVMVCRLLSRRLKLAYMEWKPQKRQSGLGLVH